MPNPDPSELATDDLPDGVDPPTLDELQAATEFFEALDASK